MGMAGQALKTSASVAAGVGSSAFGVAAGVGSSALGVAGSAASITGSMVRKYGPGLAYAAGREFAANAKAIADVLDTTIDVIETIAGIIRTAARGTTDSVNLGSMAYPIVFSLLASQQLRRADYFGVDISPPQL